MPSPSDRSGSNLTNFLASAQAKHHQAESWQPLLGEVAQRFNREYQREPFDVPDEVKAMPIYQEWQAGLLADKTVSPFWELATPRKHQRCLDIGCGVSFLIYPWRDWQAVFHGQDISAIACDTLNSRGPQLNSKLFKGVNRGGAHELQYDGDQFDLAIATGFSCYYPLDYWKLVMDEVRRVLKPDGLFIFDVVDPELPLAENWAILETYLGAEVFLETQNHWRQVLEDNRAEVLKQHPGEIFRLFKARFRR